MMQGAYAQYIYIYLSLSLSVSLSLALSLSLSLWVPQQPIIPLIVTTPLLLKGLVSLNPKPQEPKPYIPKPYTPRVPLKEPRKKPYRTH